MVDWFNQVDTTYRTDLRDFNELNFQRFDAKLEQRFAQYDAKLEQRIVASRVPDVEARLNKQLVSFVQMVREQDLKKLPSISETIDWARVLLLLHADALNGDLVRDTLNVLLKYETDIDAVTPQVSELVRKSAQAVR
jgi:hypothetical protein